MPLNLDNIDYDSLSALEDVDATGQVKSTVFEAVKEDPDAAAKRKQLSTDSGVPLFAIPGAEAEIETKLKLDKIDFDRLAEESPATFSALGEFDNAAIIHDEIGGFEKAEAAIKATANYIEDIGEAFTLGQGIVRQSELGMTRLLNQIGAGDPITDEHLAELNKLEADAKRINEDHQYGLFLGIPVTASEQVPIYWEILKQGLAGTGIGAATGGATGAAIGAVTGPGAAPAALTGGVIGAKWGGRAGVAKGSFELEAGLAFNEYVAMKDEQGNLMNPDIAAAGAVTVGAVNAGLEFASFWALGRTITPAMRLVLRNKVKQILLTQTGRAAMAEIGRRYAAAVAAEGVTEFFQEMSTIIGAEFGKLLDEDSFTDHDVGKAFDSVVAQLPRALDAGVKGAQAGVVFGAPGTITSSVLENRTLRREMSENKGQQLDALNESLSNLKTKERSKETFKQFVESADGDNNTTVFIDGVQAALYLQTKTAEEIAASPALQLLQKQVREAAALGNDVQVNVSDFAADIAGTDHYAALREHMTLDADLPTPFRADQEVKAAEQYVKDLMRTAGEHHSQYVEAQAIWEQVKDQIADTGQVNEQNAGIMAQLVPAYLTVQSVRTGRPIADLFAERGFTVEGPQTGKMAEFETPVIPPEQIKARTTETQERRQATTQVSEERRAGDRRKDAERRARIEAMTPEERYDLIYRDELTGINNRRAFEEDVAEAPFVASIDVDSLGITNDELGHNVGDTLLRVVAKALNDSAPGRAYHISGDEFYLTGDSQQEVQTALDAAQAALAGERVRGERGVLSGPRITYGIAQGKEAADTLMEQTKKDRLASGERVAKGQVPNNLELNDATLATDFYNALISAKDANPNGASVFVWPKEDYAKLDLFLYDGGKAGFAITSAGDLVSVFKHPDSTMKNALSILVPEAIRQGARTLDAFEGFLTDQYKKYGFVEVDRAPWDDELAPSTWDKATMGTPDVVFMELSDEAKRAADEAQAESVQKPERIRRGTRILEQPSRQDTRSGREQDGSLRGLPRNIAGYRPHHNETIAKVARKYMREAGLPYNPPNRYVPVDVDRAERIAAEFDKMQHDPSNPDVAAAYQALIDETVAQYRAALDAGLQVEFITERDENGDLIDPYDDSPRMAIDDINDNNHMWVFSTRDGFGTSDFDPTDNPLLAETEFTDINGTPMLANDLFRVVHDYFGHAKEGVGFRAAGEENAWRAHSAMFSPLARKALTTETRGQNSWLNYGPYGETNRTAKTKDTMFADQKIGLLPDWVVEDGAGDPQVFYQSVSPIQGTGIDRLYLASLKTVLNLKLPQWQHNKKALGAIRARMDGLFQQRDELRAQLDGIDREFKRGLDELNALDGVTPGQVNDYINNAADGAELEGQIREVERQIAVTNRELHNPLARGADIWAKLKSDGLKAEEIEYTGIEEFLTIDPDAKFSRDDVAQYLSKNGINIEEVLADEEGRSSIDDLEWTESIDDDSENWQGYVEELLWEFQQVNRLENLEESFEMSWSLNLDTYKEKVRGWIDENPSFPDVQEYKELSAKLEETDRRLDHVEAGQGELDLGDRKEWVNLRDELRDELEELEDSLYLAVGQDPASTVYDWVMEQADEVAKESYMDDPYVLHTLSDTGDVDVTIYGNESNGYRGMIDGHQVFEHVYGFHEAQIHILDALRDEDIGNDENTVAKWESYTMDGDFDNYRELKLKLPDVDGDFYETAHFPDRNILAFLRVDDRFLETGVIDDEVFQSKHKVDFRVIDNPVEGALNKRLVEVFDADTGVPLTTFAPADWRLSDVELIEEVRDKVATAEAGLRLVNNLETLGDGMVGIRKPPKRGVNTYFIDELQSDWHSQGRTRGYKRGVDTAPLVEESQGIRKKIMDAYNYRFDAFMDLAHLLTDDKITKKEVNELLEIRFRDDEETINDFKRYIELDKQARAEISGVPDAPFKGDAWLSLALKRALVDAAEGGYKAIAWPNDATLKDRWHSNYNYAPQYDRKMPSIIKKLTKSKRPPVEMDLDTREPFSEPLTELPDDLRVVEVAEQRWAVMSKPNPDQGGLGRHLTDGYDSEQEAIDAYLAEVNERGKGYWIIELTPEIRDRITEEGFPLFQEERGYYDPSQSLIRLTEASNLSTFLHEFAHYMLEQEREYSGVFLTDINRWFDRIADQVAKEAGDDVSETDVHNYVNYGTTGDAAKDANVRRATHEQFARAWEQYLMEGKSPSIELRNAFRAFARWLAQLYRRLSNQLDQNLDDEMRRVFDRMIATEEQIEMAEAREHFAPLFTDATMAGMSEEQFQKYKADREKIKDHAAETLRDKLIKELTRTQQLWWIQTKADVIDDERERLRAEPIYRAMDRLKTGDIKLDHATVKELVGETRVDKRGRISVVVPSALSGMTAKGQIGVSPDDAAAFFGFASGEELIHTILRTPSLDDAADTAAEQIMIQRHGDIMSDGTIEQLADEALQNETKAEFILSELKALRRGTNQPAIDRNVVKQLAEERIGQLSYREIHPEKYRRAEIRAAQEAAAALAKGDREGAAIAKTQQLINHFLAREATQARDKTLSIVDFMNRYGKKRVRERILKAENGYMEQIDKILGRFEFRKSATLASVDKVNEGLREWVNKRIQEHGDALVLSPATLDESYTTHWKNIKYDDLRGIQDSIKNIEHVARYIDKIRVLTEERDFRQVVEQIVDHLDKQPVAHQAQRTDVITGRKFGKLAMAQMTKIPWLASWLDGGERAGLMHDILVAPMSEAYDRELDLLRDVALPVIKALENRSKDDKKRHGQKLYIPELKTGDHDGMLFGHQVLAVALNTGNEGNLRKMLLGEGWANEANPESINIDNPQLQAVLTHMTKADWDLVQQIWDQMELLYPMLADVHRKTTGMVPPKVEATSVPTPFGDYRGGYYPVKYDPNRSFRAAETEERATAETESMFSIGASLQAQVNTGATEARTGYFAPVRLSLDVVPSHFQETIHYITFHDAVRQTNKIIRNQDVAAAIKRVVGPEEYAQLRPWLNDIAKDGRETPTKTLIDAAMQRLRFGVTLGVMGFKASTGLMQLLGLSNTIGEVGVKNTMKAVKMIIGSPEHIQEAWEFAVENSKVMEHRAETMDREIKNAMRQIKGKSGLLPAAQETSMKHIALIQTYMVDLPTWYAAYLKGVEQWGDEARASRYADWAVENIQGSGAIHNMATIMRNQTETHRMFTMFMTFFSSLWNMERDLVRGARSGRYSVTNVAAKAMWFFVVPMFLETLMRGDWGDEDDEDELQRFLLNTALYPAQSIPFIRDAANGLLGEYRYQITPIAGVLEQGFKTLPEIVERGFTDEEITKGQWKGGSKFVGAVTGIPGVNQAWATGEHLYEVLEEGEDLTIRELIYGPKK